MPKMTKKGQKFVGGEISKLVRKGPSKGPQKGKPYPQKQAVAAALSIARRKGYKGAERPGQAEAVLYRDPEYGAFAVVQVREDGRARLVTCDHNSVDAPAIVAVLDRFASPQQLGGGVVEWHLKRGSHQAILMAEVQRVVQGLGYEDDPLAERAALQVSEMEALMPDLPGSDRFHLTHEPLEAGLRRHVEVAFAALKEHGRATPPTIKFHGRPNTRDTFGRPLPFVIARAFFESDDIEAAAVALKEALRPVESCLVRASIKENDGLHTVEVALAPAAAMCEAYMDASIPTFESHALSGARTVWMSLGTALDLEEAADIGRLAAVSTGAVGLRTERDGRAVVAHIPSSHPGTHVGDHAFQERLGWLIRLLDPWDPEVKDIGEQVAMQAGAPSQRDGLAEATDPGMEPSQPPRALDADAIRELTLYLHTSDAQSYRDSVKLNKQYAKRKKKGTYRRDLAAQGYLNYVVTPTAKRYVREFGGDLSITFPKKEREFISMELAKRFERLFRDELPGDLGLNDQWESLQEATRGEVADSVLIPAKYNMNVAKIDAAAARRYAEKLYEQAGADLDADLPNLDRNFELLKGKMRYALTIKRKDMPVIDPKDIPKFGQRLQTGQIDIFEPWADVSKLYGPEVARRTPELGGGKFPTWNQMKGGTKGRIWVTLGKADGSPDDDRIEANIGMVAVKDLRPLQNEIWYDKLIASILKYGPPAPGGFLLTAAIIIVSQEGYILDGHHRFGQAMLTDPNLKIKALQIPLDIKTLLKVGLSYGAAIGRAPRESVDESLKTDFYAAAARGKPFRVMHADGMDSLVWKTGPREWKIQTGDRGIIVVTSPRDAWGAVTGYGYESNPVSVMGEDVSEASGEIAGLLKRWDAVNRDYVKVFKKRMDMERLIDPRGGAAFSGAQDAAGAEVEYNRLRAEEERLKKERDALTAKLVPLYRGGERPPASMMGMGSMDYIFRSQAGPEMARSLRQDRLSRRESVTFHEGKMVVLRGSGKDTTPTIPKGSVVTVGAPRDPEKDIPDEMSVLKQKLKAAQDTYKRVGEKPVRRDEAAANLVYTLKQDPRYPNDDGALLLRAWWPETMVSATGAARSVAVERWSDGGWRAAGMREPQGTADDAARAWLAKKNGVSPRQMVRE